MVLVTMLITLLVTVLVTVLFTRNIHFHIEGMGVPATYLVALQGGAAKTVGLLVVLSLVYHHQRAQQFE